MSPSHPAWNSGVSAVTLAVWIATSPSPASTTSTHDRTFRQLKDSRPVSADIVKTSPTASAFFEIRSESEQGCAANFEREEQVQKVLPGPLDLVKRVNEQIV